ncbi:hypothetical protein HPPC_03290 [Helicobacter pylori PeCan4]|nr:hypothetical protein HPPC_03290 [Helicobacter pylori PeCan4]
MKVTQGITDDFFALTNTIFSILKIRKCIMKFYHYAFNKGFF